MKTFIAFALCTLFAYTAEAGPHRAARQQQRIANGVASGELTARETVRLERQQARIARTIARDKADGGGLSVRERVKIQRMQNEASRAIHRQKHDRQDR